MKNNRTRLNETAVLAKADLPYGGNTSRNNCRKTNIDSHVVSNVVPSYWNNASPASILLSVLLFEYAVDIVQLLVWGCLEATAPILLVPPFQHIHDPVLVWPSLQDSP
ncbi:hypothetical protein J6590_028158 [Homalodisca vitripennis]|nr:hypothetical protein J6590_028158 [Homalodisca vitripennis]